MRLGVRRLLVAGAAMALASPAFAQSTGTIAGRVTERTTNRPLAGVQIRVVGTTRGAATNDSGGYRIPGVPAGTVQLAVQRIGYGVASRSVVVSGLAETGSRGPVVAGAPEVTRMAYPASG